MNLSISVLSVSFLLSSPFIVPSCSIMNPMQYHFSKISVHSSFSSFFYSKVNKINAFYIHSRFTNLLNSPIIMCQSVHIDDVFKKNEYIKEKMDYSKDSSTALYYCNALTIVECIFNNIEPSNKHFRGGAIRFKNEQGNCTIYGTIFNNCSTKGDGGAIFVCGKEYNSGDNMTHLMANYFNSSYCCYSKCSAKITNVENSKSGYGSAMLISAKNIDLYYSSSNECPKGVDEQVYGAQFDLQSNVVKSSFINATSGNSKYCAAIEYRRASSGIFEFQTIVNQKGSFITSFTSVQLNVVISKSNFVNETIIEPEDASVLGGVIHIREFNINASDLCFLNINFNGTSDKMKFVSFNNGANSNCFLIGCTFDADYSEYINGLNIEDKKNYDDFYSTHTIDQLFLGACEGAKIVPPTYLTEYFSQSKVFSKSSVFSDSSDFTKSSIFPDSSDFTKSSIFSDSSDFTKSSIFSDSSDFTKSSFFSGSSDFTKSSIFPDSSDFTKSSFFSGSSDFPKSSIFFGSMNFTGSFNFSKSSIFSKTLGFSGSPDFSKSSYFSNSMIFSNSNSFTKSCDFSCSSSFTTQSNQCSHSNLFSKSESFSQTFFFSNSEFHSKLETFTKPNTIISSNIFTVSAEFNAQSQINIKIKTEENNKISKKSIIGIGVGLGLTALAAILIVTLLLVKKYKMTNISFEEETIEITDNKSETIFTNNLLNGMMSEDDPFSDDFISI